MKKDIISDTWGDLWDVHSTRNGDNHPPLCLGWPNGSRQDVVVIIGLDAAKAFRALLKRLAQTAQNQTDDKA